MDVVVPLRIFEDLVPKKSDGERIRRVTDHLLPAQLASGRHRPVDIRLRPRVHRRGINRPDRFDLRRRETVRSVAVPAQQRAGIERAVRWILDYAILDSILCIARSESTL